MINYSVTPRPNPQNPDAAPKFFGAAQSVGNLDINEFAKHISSHGCVYGRADIAAVLTLAVDCARHLLLDGYRVTLGDLGTFGVTLVCKGTKTNDAFTSDNIEKVKVTWRPGHGFDNLRDDAEFNKVPTRLAQAAILASESDGNKTVDLAAIKATEAAKRKKS